MTVVRLPIAGIDVVLRPPIGADDVMLLEAGPPDMRVAIALLARIAAGVDGGALDPAALPIGDIDALLLRLRQRLYGDAVSADDVCPEPGCHARVDISFSIGAYLEHHRPAAPPGVDAASERDWYRLADAAVEFRVPRADDVLAIERADDPEDALVRRCVRAAAFGEDARRRVEDALEVLAPSLVTELEGVCPACGAIVHATFDPLQYTLRELRDQAAFVYDDVCAIAHHYHWSEAAILALPAERRTRYAELAAQHARAGRTTA